MLMDQWPSKIYQLFPILILSRMSKPNVDTRLTFAPFYCQFQHFNIHSQYKLKKISNALMRYPVSSILPLLITILSFIHTVTAEWSSYAYLSTKIPAHTYAVFCAANSQISGNVTWSGTNSDLDLFAYKQGSDILDPQAALVRFQTTTPEKQAFLINCSITGTYYLRVQPYLIHRSYTFFSYSISLSTNDLHQSTYTSTFYGKSQENKRKQIFLLSPPITTGIAVKYESLSDTSMFSISCYGTSFNQQYKLTKGASICLPAQSSSYIFMIKENNILLTSFQPIQISFYYDLTLNCQKKQSTSDQTAPYTVGIIVGIIVSCVVAFIAIIILIIVFWKKRCKKDNKKMQQSQNPSITSNPYAEQHTFSTLKQNPNQNCSICLELNCNARLECGHFYHQKCIEEWMKKNNQCPVCRIKIRKSKLEMNQKK